MSRIAVDVGRWPVLLLIILLPVFAVGMFARGIWTPDEPREMAIAWSMAQQPDKAVPHLGEDVFCEKPPLAYWMAGGSMAVFGKSPAAARLPNLLYALIGAFVIALLARSMAPSSAVHAGKAALAALAAGVVMGTMEMSWQVAIWMASDAPLLMGVCVALLGAWRGLNATPGRAKLGWYLLMHMGLLIGFFSKNAVAWMVPGLATAAWIAWERRWAELVRWELWSGFLLQGLFIGAWVAAVAAGADGQRHLEVFFIDNLLGRFISNTAALEHIGRWFSPGYQSRMGYHEGHHNWFGKYLVELPAYILPWLFLVAVAAWRSFPVLRTRVVDEVVERERSAWRFAWCIIVPNLLLLMLASTARGIYLAPLLPGFALLVGLWAAHLPDEDRALDRHALSATALLIAGLAAALLPAVLIYTQWKQIRIPGEAMMLIGAASVLGVVKLLVTISHIRARQTGSVAREMIITLVALWLLIGLAMPKVLDRWQNLEPLAGVVTRYAKNHRLIIMNADETTRAAIFWHAGLSLVHSSNDMEVKGKPACLALRKMPDPADEHAATVADLKSKGWRLIERIDIAFPHGRRYAVFASQDIADQIAP